MSDPVKKIKSLSFWNGPITIEPLSGGITNVNYLASDSEETYVVRLGEDIPEHHVMRFNELAASLAACEAGISPAVRYSEPGILVLAYIPSKTFAAEDVQNQGNLERILNLIKTCHHELPKHLRGPSLVFWVFQVVRDYALTLQSGNSSWRSKLPELLEKAARLEKLGGPFDIVFGHNDLLPANILDDGKRLWLIDWDYAGFNSPLFDLGGLASNCELLPGQENWLLENYFEQPLTDQLQCRYQAMKCASLLRETMWSMVSEIHSKIDFDFASYTRENLERFEHTYGQLDQDLT